MTISLSILKCCYIIVGLPWCLPIQETGSIPGQEHPLEKEMATHSLILAWTSPWTGKPGGLQSMGSQRVRHDWVTKQQPQYLLWVCMVFPKWQNSQPQGGNSCVCLCLLISMDRRNIRLSQSQLYGLFINTPHGASNQIRAQHVLFELHSRCHS